MISTAQDGGTVTNYSPRFTLTGMTGTTNERYVDQVQALGGSTNGPATVNDVVPKAADPQPAPVDPGLAGFGIPYNKQVGPTKYAPMQPVPPTKITAGNPTPLYPTSAFNIAQGKLPPPTILTTLTASQTFKVQSVENTVRIFGAHTLTVLDRRLIFATDRATEQSKGRYGEIPGAVEGLRAMLGDSIYRT